MAKHRENEMKKEDEAAKQDPKKGPVGGGDDKSPADLSPEKKAEKKEKHEDGEMPPKKAAPSDGEEPHDDEDQDKKLILQMLDKYLGDKAYDQEAYEMAKEAYSAAHEMGYEGADAMKCAGHSLQMARHMRQKMKQDEAKMNQDESEGSMKHDEKHEDEAKMKHSEKKEDEGKKESSTPKIIAENIVLREENKKLKLEKYTETLCEKSGLPHSLTKKFKEDALKARSTEQVDGIFNVYRSAYQEAKKISGEADLLEGMVLTAEKKGETATGGLNLADCLN